MHDCKHCIYGVKPKLGCSNREEEICLKELKVGDKIQFYDPYNSKVTETEIIREITKTLNLTFDGWGINGAFVTKIKILERDGLPYN